MLEQLVNFGKEVDPSVKEFNEIDITDKLMLEEQVNAARKAWFKTLEIIDGVRADIIKNESEIRKIKAGKKAAELLLDEEYRKVMEKSDILQAQLSAAQGLLDFHKFSAKMLNSSMYSKF